MASFSHPVARAISLLRQPLHASATRSGSAASHLGRNSNRYERLRASSLQCRALSQSSRLRQAQPAAAPAKTSSTPTSSTPKASTSTTQSTTQPRPGDLKAGLFDRPVPNSDPDGQDIDWSTSFQGLADAPFSKEAAEVLMRPVDPNDVEVKPDGIIFLPEIKYRRILNRAFGPGGWGLAPRGESTVTPKAVTREYALLAHGR